MYLADLSRLFDLSEGLPLLDHEQVGFLHDADPDLLDDLIETFTGVCGPKVDSLPSVAGRREPALLREEIHFIGGSAANIGLFRLAELCRCIEQQIRENRFTAFEQVAAFVQTEYAHGLAELTELVFD